MRLKRDNLLFPAGLVLLVLLLYAPAFTIRPYCDDWAHVYYAKTRGFDIFFKGWMFRPFERLVNAVNYMCFDVYGSVSVGINVLGLLLGGLLVFALARRWWRAPATAFLAATLFLLHSVNTAAIFQIDLVSQQLNTLSVLLALFWFTRPVGNSARYYAVGAWLTSMTLLTKETAIGGVCMLPVVHFVSVRFLQGRPLREAGWRACIAAVMCMVPAIGYLGVRELFSITTPGMTSGRYALDFSPVHVLRNAATLLGSVGYLGSTLEIMARRPDWRIAVSVVHTGFWLALALGGVRSLLKRKRKDIFVPLGICWLMLASGLVPAVFLGRVSEQYAYLLSPFLALILARLATAGCQNPAPESPTGIAIRRRARVLPAVAAACYTIWMSIGISEKLACANRIGKDAWQYSRQFDAWTKTLPPDAGYIRTIRLAGEVDRLHPPLAREYSVFAKRSAELIEEYALYYGPKNTRFVFTTDSARPCDAVMRIEGLNLAIARNPISDAR